MMNVFIYSKEFLIKWQLEILCLTDNFGKLFLSSNWSILFFELLLLSNNFYVYSELSLVLEVFCTVIYESLN